MPREVRRSSPCYDNPCKALMETLHEVLLSPDVPSLLWPNSHSIIITSKPPALPVDPKSLTFPGVYQSLPFLKRSKFIKREASDVRVSTFKSHGLGMQVPRRVDSEIAAKGAVRRT